MNVFSLSHYYSGLRWARLVPICGTFSPVLRLFLHHIFVYLECIEEDIAYPGNDIQCLKGITTMKECIQKCQERANCEFWTLRKKFQLCCLKRSNAGRTVDNRAVSGTRNCFCSGEFYNDLSWILKFHLKINLSSIKCIMRSIT